MLHLASDTPAAWVERMLPHLDTLLLDHAHCEKKAASTAINLIFRYQRQPELCRPLSELAREELTHFEQMLDVLEARGIPFEPLDPSPYAKQLFTRVRHGEPERLLDTLLVLSLIEARSCERMKRLAEHLPDPTLRELYAGLLASEARHHSSYVTLAQRHAPREVVMARLADLAAFEATLLGEPSAPPRMHT